jgi:hypothetical protein
MSREQLIITEIHEGAQDISLEGIDPNLVIGTNTVMHEAVLQGRDDLLPKLFELGGRLDTPNSIGDTPLQHLARSIVSNDFTIDQFLNTICLLLEHGASVDEIQALMAEYAEDDEALAKIEQLAEEAEKCFDEERSQSIKTETSTTPEVEGQGHGTDYSVSLGLLFAIEIATHLSGDLASLNHVS